MKVAILQMQVALGEPDTNIATLQQLAAQAMTKKPDVLLLPELWLQGFYPRPITDYADTDGRTAQSILGRLAQNYQVNIVGGTVARAHQGQVFNTCYIFNRAGQLTASYDKTHLFSPSEEHKAFVPGNKLVTFTLDGTKCGIAVCYDLRFPELCRSLALSGIQVLFLPAAWPLKRLRHWQILLQARAIENQFFVAACNAAGIDGSRQQLAGHSAIIDPWGEILASAGTAEAVIDCQLDLAVQTGIKLSIDVFGDRRPQLYASGLK